MYLHRYSRLFREQLSKHELRRLRKEDERRARKEEAIRLREEARKNAEMSELYAQGVKLNSL